MENQIKQKLNRQFKKIILALILLFIILVVWFIHYVKTFSIPKSSISTLCEEKLIEGMTKQEVIHLLGPDNFQSEVIESEPLSSHIFFSYKGRNPMIWDYKVYVSLKNDKMVDKDCFWGF